jgi:glycosyltransferase involved in cell wall biosynthesis
VSLGALTPLKGFLDVFDALAPRAGDTSFRWTLIGSCDAHAAHAREIAERARSFPGVTLAGQLAPEEARRRVQQADVLVMPSYVENQPLVVLEAMAASVPAVAYAAGAVAHMIEHGREGLIGPVGDRAVLARNLTRLIDDEAERARMAEACWQRQRSLPSWREAALALRRALGAG